MYNTNNVHKRWFVHEHYFQITLFKISLTIFPFYVHSLAAYVVYRVCVYVSAFLSHFTLKTWKCARNEIYFAPHKTTAATKAHRKVHITVFACVCVCVYDFNCKTAPHTQKHLLHWPKLYGIHGNFNAIEPYKKSHMQRENRHLESVRTPNLYLICVRVPLFPKWFVWTVALYAAMFDCVRPSANIHSHSRKKSIRLAEMRFRCAIRVISFFRFSHRIRTFRYPFFYRNNFICNITSNVH